MTPLSDFYIYLTSRSCINIFPKNSSSKFTNRIFPQIIFENIQEWEVGLTSLILPFKKDQIQFSKDIKYEIKIKKKFFEKISPDNEKIQIYDLERVVSFTPTELINLNSKRIFNIFIKKIASEINIKDILLEKFFLSYEKDYLLIQSHFYNKPLHDDLKDLLYLQIEFNEHAKNLFGYDNNTFILYDVQDESLTNKFIGNKKINLNINHPNFILVYADIVTTTQYGSQQISLLDVLPFGNSYSNDRKNNVISYKGLSSRIITNISIILTDPNHDIVNIYSEDCVICLHFRKKSFILKTIT